MLSLRIMLSLALVMCILNLCSCSRGTVFEPVVPSDSSLNQEIPEFSDQTPVLVSDYDLSGKPREGTGLLGLFQGHIDINSLTGELTPLRTASSFDVLEIVDITNFLTVTPCHYCARITGVFLDDDENIRVRFIMKHPFPVGNPQAPISGQNRADLSVFNVEGQIFSDWGGNATVFPQLGKSVHFMRVLNADGYSPYFTQYINDDFPTGANLAPYKLFFDDYSIGNFDPFSTHGFTDYLHPSGNLVMAMGSSWNEQEYVLDINEEESFDFIFAVGCTYGISADTKKDRFNPVYRVPQFNKKAASEVSVSIEANDLIENNPNSTASIRVEVLDINHGARIGSDLNDMRYESNVKAIHIEVPGVIDGTYDFIDPIEKGGDPRSPSNPLYFILDIHNDLANGTNWGYHKGLVKVMDSYSPGTNANPLLDGLDGIHAVSPIANPLAGLFPMAEFATYQTFEIWVEPGQPHPVCEFRVAGSTQIYAGGLVEFDATDSYDPNGIITSYMWDFNDDGTFGDSYDEGTDSNPVKRFITCGIFDIGLHLVDNEDGWTNCYDARITVLPNQPPICDFEAVSPTDIYEGTSVSFDATASHDPDGLIAQYLWDFDGDNNFGDTHSGDPWRPIHIFADPGTYDVQLKVVDNRQSVSYCGGVTVTVENIQQFDGPDEDPSPPGMFFGDILNPVFHHSLAANGDNIFIVFGGRVGMNYSYFSIYSGDGGVTWGSAVPITTHIEDSYSTGTSEGIAVAIANSNPPRPVAAWIDNDEDLIYAYGSSDGSSWFVNRNMRADDTPVYDVAIATYPNNDSFAYIVLRDSSYFNREAIILVGVNNALSALPNVRYYRVDNDTATNIQKADPNLAIGPSGDAFVVYNWTANVSPADQIHLRKFMGPPDGMTYNAIQRVDTGGVDRGCFMPSVAIDANNNPVVVFQDDSFDPSSPYDIDIAINIGTGSIPTFGSKTRLNEGTTHSNSATLQFYDQRNPVVMVNRDSGLIWVTYQDNRDSFFKPQIYYTVRNSNLELIEEASVVQSDPTFTHRHLYSHPDMADCDDPDTKIYVLWQDIDASATSNFRFQVAE
jgi:PKD repeat protein